MTDTRIPATPATARTTAYWEIVAQLAAKQKTAAGSAPAYSVFVNRKLGRLLAAWAYRAGLTPNAVTAVSAAFTFSGIALLMLFPPSGWLGVAVALLLVIGYAFDSADGQVARLRGGGSLSGEWLDHVVDATKLSLLPLSLAVGLYRFQAVDTAWLLVPLGSAVVSAVLFFGMILTEQLRRQLGVKPAVAAKSPGSWRRSLLFLPMDYGVLCLSFLLLGSTAVFTTVYTLIFAGTTVFLIAALPKWYRDLTYAGKQER
ncbi:CDP-alcohol phosphatidyltransferase family protein [Pseudarthrobacter sp. PvP090]|uniref:CDP-alcohol phosphatidyltransferase family protein n=1 Tax=Pseudarthrobacter sp. PvP090 TaxID=3156393 RepID=UPI003392EE90